MAGAPAGNCGSRQYLSLDFLAKLGWLVEIGYAEQLDVERAGADSPVGPTLVFDPTRPSSRKVVKKCVKAKKSAAKAQPANAAT